MAKERIFLIVVDCPVNRKQPFNTYMPYINTNFFYDSCILTYTSKPSYQHLRTMVCDTPVSEQSQIQSITAISTGRVSLYLNTSSGLRFSP